MKKCKYCQTEIEKADKFCTKCGRKTKQGLPTWAIVIIVIIALLIFISLPGTEEESKPQTGVTTEEPKEDLTLQSGHKGYADEYNISYYIEGTVKNNTDKKYSYVDIEFSVYDKDGNNLGSCYDNNSNLDPNGSWKFKAICSGEPSEIASYKLVEISGY